MGFTFTGNDFPNVAITTPLVMFLWIPAVLYLFSRFPARKAVVISFIVAWLYLPQAELDLPGIPDYTKASATCYGILLATFIYDAGRFSTFRFGWVDVPMAIWCLFCPFTSSITNGLGAYDGFSATLGQVVTWGIPYFLGRIYINNLEGFRLLAMGIFMGGLSYVPLCLFENRFSPQLHRIVYGDHAFADFGQSIRLGGFRPTIFLQHGLAVGAFMMVATLCGVWLWQTKAVKKVWNIPIKWAVAALFVTFILVRSTGAYALFAAGLGIMFVGKRFRTALPVFLIIGAIGVYLYISAATENYITDQLIDTLSQVFPPERIESLEFRFDNEELLVDKARIRPWFGWGGFGRALVATDEYGGQTIQDSLWIIAFGHNGAVGLISLFTGMLLPVIALFWSRYPARLWFNPKVAPTVVLAIGVVLYMTDSILNALVNPIYVVAAGGIATMALKPREKLNKAPRSIPASARSRQLSPQR
jgi:hypothetical protein